MDTYYKEVEIRDKDQLDIYHQKYINQKYPKMTWKSTGND